MSTDHLSVPYDTPNKSTYKRFISSNPSGGLCSDYEVGDGDDKYLYFV